MEADSIGRRYDRIGVAYRSRRRPDPRWESMIQMALGDSVSVVNVGAGTGSYEPSDRRVIAVEPSPTMIDQRESGNTPVVRGSAEHLPFPSGTFDAALAIFTVHHWPDPIRGLAELQRVSRRQVVVTWDPDVFAQRMWLVAEYLPEIYEREATLATETMIVERLRSPATRILPVPFDCTDGVLGAYWRRPEAFLDPAVRRATSGIALLDDDVVTRAITRLGDDLANGVWYDRHADLLDRTELDLGYRLIVAESS